MEIHPVGAEFSLRTDGRTDERTDGETDMMKLIVPFRNFANTPKRKRRVLKPCILLQITVRISFAFVRLL